MFPGDTFLYSYILRSDKFTIILKNDINNIINNNSFEHINDIKEDFEYLINYFIGKGYKCETVKIDNNKYLVIKNIVL